MFERLCNEFILSAEENSLWSRKKKVSFVTCQTMHVLLKVIRQILPNYAVRDKNSHQLISSKQVERKVFDRFIEEEHIQNGKFRQMVEAVVRDLLDKYDIQPAE